MHYHVVPLLKWYSLAFLKIHFQFLSVELEYKRHVNRHGITTLNVSRLSSEITPLQDTELEMCVYDIHIFQLPEI